MISDVPGDDPAFIGSGPTVGDCSTPADATEVLRRWSIPVPDSVTAALSRPTGVVPPGDPRLGRVQNFIYAAPAQSRDLAGEDPEVQVRGAADRRRVAGGVHVHDVGADGDVHGRRQAAPHPDRER